MASIPCMKNDIRRLSLSLITGFLGSGKTTLLDRIVSSADFAAGKSALLINDAGPVNIDAKIFKGRAKEIKAITGGCICCVNPEEMKQSLLEFALVPEIEQVWIEASGIAETEDILDRLMDHPLPQKTLIQEIIHVIDAQQGVGGLLEAMNQKKQAALANRILINKTDLVPPKNITEITEKIRSWNPHALIQATVRCDIDLSLVPPSPPTPPPYSENFGKKTQSHLDWKTVWIPIPKPQSFQKIQKFLDHLPKEIYRVKGFVIISDKNHPTYFIQKVGAQSEMIAWEYSGSVEEHGLVLLGRGKNVDQIQWKNN